MGNSLVKRVSDYQEERLREAEKLSQNMAAIDAKNASGFTVDGLLAAGIIGGFATVGVNKLFNVNTTISLSPPNKTQSTGLRLQAVLLGHTPIVVVITGTKIGFSN